MRVIDDLDAHLGRFREAVEARGGARSSPRTAAEANAVHRRHLPATPARSSAAKSKSMATEEIGLNEALEAAGVARSRPTSASTSSSSPGEHPVAHHRARRSRRRRRTSPSCSRAWTASRWPPELEELTQAARRAAARDVPRGRRRHHRRELRASRETGSIVLVTNEGNGRLVDQPAARARRAHGHGAGRAASLADLAVMLRLLAAQRHRAAADDVHDADHRAAPRGRARRARRAARRDPRQRPVEARRRAATTRCSRASAAARASTSARSTGRSAAHAYGPVYSGPMGAVLVPLLAGLEQAPDLPHASSLCGACTDACPVKIPLHELLLELRRDLVEQRVAPFHERLCVPALVVRVVVAAGYRLTTRLARLGGPFAGLVGPGRAWAKGRTLPKLGAGVTGTVDEPRRRVRRERGGRRLRRPSRRRRPRSTARASRGPRTRWPTPAASCSRPRRTSRAPRRCCPTSTSRSSPRTSSSPGLEELFAAVGDDLPSSLAIVTGPSRSADIEQLLTVGVHGPGEVHVVIQGR